MSHNYYRLVEYILPLSRATTFELAKLEWELTGAHLVDDHDYCPCGKSIKELCYIRNTETGATTYVGNVCIKQFLGIDTGNLFAGLRRIAENPGANPNADLIEHARKLGYIYPSEYKFLRQTRNKRSLSAGQLSWKQKINRRILNRIVVSNPQPN